VASRVHDFYLLIVTHYVLLLLLRVEDQMRSTLDLLMYKVSLVGLSLLLSLPLSRD